MGKWIRREAGRLVLFLCLLAADQLSKWAVVSYLKGAPPLVLIPGVLEFVYTENTGAAFGALFGNNLLLLCLNLVLVLVIAWAYTRLPAAKKWSRLRVTGAVLLAGALGNIIDRIVHGFVVDFVYFVPINFPRFNLADCCVVLSAIALFLLLCFAYKEIDLKELHFFGRSSAGGNGDASVPNTAGDDTPPGEAPNGDAPKDE